MLGDDDGRFLMDKETGEMKLIHAVTDKLATPVLHLKVMVRATASVLGEGLQHINVTALPFPPSVLQPGVSGRRPQEVLCCDSVGPSSGSEPFLPRVRHDRISRLCNCREDARLSGQHIWQQSPDVTRKRSRL